MPKSKKLKNKISKKLDKLQKIADKVQVIQIINSDDPDTWDSDTLYDLVVNLKVALQILEDKKHPKEKDPFGDPLILEERPIPRRRKWRLWLKKQLSTTCFLILFELLENAILVKLNSPSKIINLLLRKY